MQKSQVWCAILCFACCLCVTPDHRAAATSVAVAPLQQRSGFSDSEVDFNQDGYSDLALRSEDWFNDEGQWGGAIQVIYGARDGLSKRSNQYWAAKDFPGFVMSDSGSEFGRSLAAGDFDNDGFSDLAVGDPVAAVGAVRFAGAVRIIFGSARGLTASRSQLLTGDTPGMIGGGARQEGQFGRSLAAANFGNGAQRDLAIGASPESVHIVYGSAGGLAAKGNQVWGPSTPDVGRTSGGDFGASLAAGNFAGRDYADLAIGAPVADVDDEFMAGAVHVLYGSFRGLTAQGSQRWTQDSRGIVGRAMGADGFGTSLAAAPFAGTRFDDLAIGVPGNGASGASSGAGAVNVIYGSDHGLSAEGNQLWSQKSKGIQGRRGADDGFGRSLAAGNFGRDRRGRTYADLAVGVPHDSVGRKQEAGSVNVIFGSQHGLSAKDDRRVTQDSAGIRGASREFDWFGSALAAGNFGNNFNGGRYADLAIGVPQDSVGRTEAASAISVIYGARPGLTSAGDQLWTPASFGQPINHVSSFASVLTSG